jgi:hypothetical protein
VVERIVAVVRNPASGTPRPLTLTKLVEEARVALVGQGATEAATAPLDDAALRAALRWVVDQWLVSDEAARLQVGEVTREESQGAVARFRARFADGAACQAFLASIDLTEEELGVTLARGLRVQRYLDGRVSRAARVAGEERVQAELRQVISDLRARAEVRVLWPALRDEPGR